MFFIGLTINSILHFEYKQTIIDFITRKSMGNPKLYLVKWLAAIFPFIFFSCIPTEQQDLNPRMEIIPSLEISDLMGLIEEVDLLALSAMQQDLTQQKIMPLLDESSCPGTRISRDDKNKKIKVDYGDGCVSSRGLEKKGVLTISYSDEFLYKGSKMTITFENFSLNGQQMQGQRKLENLGYQVASRSLRFASETNNFQVINSEGQRFILNQAYIRDLQLSTEKTGFRIYLSGYGTLSTDNFSKTSFEILKSIVYRQECMQSGVPAPTEGSLQLKNDKDEKILVNYDTEGCVILPD